MRYLTVLFSTLLCLAGGPSAACDNTLVLDSIWGEQDEGTISGVSCFEFQSRPNARYRFYTDADLEHEPMGDQSKRPVNGGCTVDQSSAIGCELRRTDGTIYRLKASGSPFAVTVKFIGKDEGNSKMRVEPSSVMDGDFYDIAQGHLPLNDTDWIRVELSEGETYTVETYIQDRVFDLKPGDAGYDPYDAAGEILPGMQLWRGNKRISLSEDCNYHRHRLYEHRSLTVMADRTADYRIRVKNRGVDRNVPYRVHVRKGGRTATCR